MGVKYTNNAEGLLAGNIADDATTLTLQATAGNYFPPVVGGSGDFFYCTLVNTAGAMEVIKVTEHTADSNTFQVIERAADGLRDQTAVALAWLAGDKLHARLNVKIMQTDIYNLDDDQAIIFGAGPDAQVSSDGTSLVIKNGAGDETMAKFTQNGIVALYYNNSIKFATSNTGAIVTGILAADGLFLSDDEYLIFGAGDTSHLYSNGTDTFFGDNNPAVIMQKWVSGAGVELYYADGKKLETTNTGAKVTGTLVADGLTLGDNEYITFGAGPDGTMSSDGDNIVIHVGSGGEIGAIFTLDGGVRLYYDNFAKVVTTGKGVTITGSVGITELGGPPVFDASEGKLYTLADNKLYFQSGNGVLHEIAFV